MLANTLLICGSILSGVGIIISMNTNSTAPPQSNVTLGSVSDLIERLKPLVENPNASWHSNGINIRFSTNDVNIVLETKNGNKYTSQAPTLEQAVSRITEPSNEIKSVLKGWKE